MAKKYYLFGRNTGTNKLEVINIEDGKTYGDNHNYEYDDNTLQEIDLFTLDFSSKDDIKKRTNSNSDDFFIVSKSNDETIYYPIILSNDEMSSAIKKLAQGFGYDYLDGVYVDIILDEFSAKIYSDLDFYKFIISNYPELYSDFIKSFKDYRTSNNTWSKSLYPIIRQTVESLKKYKQQKNSYDNIDNKKVDFLDNKYNSKKDEIITSKINRIFSFVNDLDYDFIVIENRNFKINKDYISCDTAEEKQLDSLDVKVKRLLFLITTCNFVNMFENIKHKDVINSLESELMNYLRDENKLNTLYAFVQLYNKCKNEKRNVKYGKK